MSHRDFDLFPVTATPYRAEQIGFRFGAKGTHTSRTIMLADLEALFIAAPQAARRADYLEAITEANCLSKVTVATRRLSGQRLGELYGLDPGIPLFRVFRRLWALDPEGYALLALLAATARDPLLAATGPAVIPLPPGTELQRDTLNAALRVSVDARLNSAVLEKVCRNAASSWTQSGHLEGRTFKRRRLVKATAANVAFGLYLAHAVGFRGADLFSSAWLQLLDCDPSRARALALDAKRAGLIDLSVAGEVVELNLARLDPVVERV